MEVDSGVSSKLSTLQKEIEDLKSSLEPRLEVLDVFKDSLLSLKENYKTGKIYP